MLCRYHKYFALLTRLIKIYNALNRSSTTTLIIHLIITVINAIQPPEYKIGNMIQIPIHAQNQTITYVNRRKGIKYTVWFGENSINRLHNTNKTTYNQTRE
jgi:hypothetical protein